MTDQSDRSSLDHLASATELVFASAAMEAKDAAIVERMAAVDEYLAVHKRIAALLKDV